MRWATEAAIKPIPRKSDMRVASLGIAACAGIDELMLFQSCGSCRVYVAGIMIVASRTGKGPSLLAAMLSVASFDFFVPLPYLAVSDVKYFVLSSCSLWPLYIN
jgi:K+-sensing histidine kinase KdpD